MAVTLIMPNFAASNPNKIMKMNRSFKEALDNRRSYYGLSDKSPISDSEIKGIIEFAVKHVPSAFNSQSTRIVLLLGMHHKQLWDIVKDALKGIVPPGAFAKTEAKIDSSFRSGFGTVLFFEDQTVVEQLQRDNPLYSNNFQVWSQHTSAMHQLAVWTMLEDAGFGASLQHYNPLIDDEVCKEWNISKSWKLVAQMPFGMPTQEAGEKTFRPIEERVLVFK